MSNRIEEIISDIFEFIEGCKYQAFSSTKIIVDRAQLEDFLTELRKYTPEEVKKYSRMLNNREKILNDAKKKARETEEKALAYADRLVSEDSITRMANEKAQEILNDAVKQANELIEKAQNESNEIRQGALSYTNDLLTGLKSIIGGTLEDTRESFNSLVSVLTNHIDIVESNQNELLESNSESSYSANTVDVSRNNYDNDSDEDIEDDYFEGDEE